MTKTKTNNNDGESNEQIITQEKELIIETPKKKCKVLSISKGLIDLSYSNNGVEYGVNIYYEPKYKNLKIGRLRQL